MTPLNIYHEKIMQGVERRYLEELDRLAGVNDDNESLEEMIMKVQKEEGRDFYDEANDN